MKAAWWIATGIAATPVLLGGVILTTDALAYRAAIRQADAACPDPAIRARMVERFKASKRSTPLLPHVYLATRLTKADSSARNHLHRGFRASLGPWLVNRTEAAGAFCALAPKRELQR